MTTSTVLVLFDIDGTLIRTDGAGIRGMNRAFKHIYGRDEVLADVPIAGRTDRAILRDGFARIGVEADEQSFGALRDRYLSVLPDEIGRPAGPEFGVLPGVEAAISALESDPAFIVALLTGNFAKGAEIKLRFFDLWRRFALGAYGDDHVDRRDLVPVAIERARGTGRTPTHVVVIGDTPLDVDCAHAHGAIAVAVATGNYDRESLERTGADEVVSTLEELAPLTRRLASLCA